MAKPKKDQLDVFDDYIKYGIDLYHRRIFYGDIEGEEGADFSFNAVDVALRGLKKLEDMGTEPIELYMNSPGGDPYDMFALYDAIQESSCKIIFYGRGKIMSAATWIMCGCDERYLSKNTRVLLHQARDLIEGSRKANEQKIDTDETLRLQRSLEELYAENSFLNEEFYRNLCKEDAYLSAQEVFELGLVDGIIDYKKRGNLRKKRIYRFNNPPESKEIKSLVKELYKRVDTQVSGKITIEIKKEEFEDIPQVDNSQEVLQQLNMPTEEKLDGSGSSSTD